MRTHKIDDLSYVDNSERWIDNLKDNNGDNGYPGYGIFFKAIYLRFEYAAFIYFTGRDDGKSLKFKILYIKENYNFDTKTEHNINATIPHHAQTHYKKIK